MKLFICILLLSWCSIFLFSGDNQNLENEKQNFFLWIMLRCQYSSEIVKRGPIHRVATCGKVTHESLFEDLDKHQLVNDPRYLYSLTDIFGNDLRNDEEGFDRQLSMYYILLVAEKKKQHTDESLKKLADAFPTTPRHRSNAKKWRSEKAARNKFLGVDCVC